MTTGKKWENRERCTGNTESDRDPENTKVRELFLKGYSVRSVQDRRRAERNEISTNLLNLNLGEKVSGREGVEKERHVEKEEEEEEEYEEAVMEDFEREGLV